MQAPLLAEGRDLFRRLITLPDEVKNGPAPAEMQDQFRRWRRRLLEAKPLKSQALLDTSDPYIGKLTVRLLAYNLESLLRESG